MKHMKRSNIYKNSTGSNIFNPETFEAHSYTWWKYLMKSGDYIVFNNYSYSPSTSKHQNDLRSLLNTEFNIQSKDIVFVECPKGLDNLSSGIELYKRRIEKLEALIAKKGTRKAKNEDRKAEIELYKHKIEVIEQIKNQ